MGNSNNKSGSVQNEAEKCTTGTNEITDNTAQPILAVSNSSGKETEGDKASIKESADPEGEESSYQSSSGNEVNNEEVSNSSSKETVGDKASIKECADLESEESSYQSSSGYKDNNEGGEVMEKADPTCVKKRIAGFRDVVKHLTRAEVEEFENKPFLTNIRIDQKSGIITVEGWQESVSDVESILKNKLQEIQSNKKVNEDAKELYEQVRWHYQGISGEERQIEDYDELSNFEIETGYQEGKDCVMLVDEEGVKSVVRFDEMIEHIENNEKDQVRVFRTDLTVKHGESETEDNPSNQNIQVFPTALVYPGVVSANMMSADELLDEPSVQESHLALTSEHQMEVSVEKPKDTRNLRLEDEYMKRRVEAHRDLILTLTKEEVNDLENMEAFANIKIDRANGFVTLDGPLRDVTDAETRILNKLQHIRRKRKVDIEKRTPMKMVKWLFQGFPGGDFVEYDEHIINTIEASYRNLNSFIRLYDSENVAYVIDFIEMVEYIENEEPCPVKLLRKVIKSKLKKLETPNV